MKYTFKNVMILGLGCLLGFTSCSDSWLNTDSTQTAEGDVIFSTTDNAKLVINGICRTMVQQHVYYGQNFNGEGTMKLLYGEYPGQDFNFPYMAPGWSPLMNNQSTITQSSSSIYDSYPWYYYYLIIGNANAVINRIDKAEGSQEEKDFLKAEALTFRAYSFFRLAELYCEPWARSNDGATDGVVLRIKEVAEAGEETDLKLSTLAETYKQVYDDLDEALRLYEVSGLTRDDIYWDATSNISFPDAPVAHAIYARAALTRQDYAVAKEHAALARANFPLMDTNTYYSGFCTPSSEWIWGVYNDASETIWYYGWQLFMACNGYYAQQNINVCINRDLVESFADSDIRKGLFLTESTFLPEDGSKTFLEVVGIESRNANKFNSTAEGQAASTKANKYVKETVASATSQAYAYASLKFQATAQPAVGCQPIFRASEMLLIEAEANYYLSLDPTAAQNSLVELNKDSGRDPQYTCTVTGEDLLKEIKKYRRLELWGEGFSWYDCKRWGDPVVRNSFKEGGNYSSYISGTFGFKDGNYVSEFWKWILPNRESDYNSAIEMK